MHQSLFIRILSFAVVRVQHPTSAVHGTTMRTTALVLDDFTTVAAQIMRLGVVLVLSDGKPIISHEQGIAYII